jgi:hypothetical protein
VTIISFERKDQKLLELQQQAMQIPNKMASDSSQIPPAGEVFTELHRGSKNCNASHFKTLPDKVRERKRSSPSSSNVLL